MATYGASSQAASTSSPFNVARPSGVASGTYMVAVIHNDAGGSGSAIAISGGTTWNSLTFGDVGGVGYRLFWKLAGPSEPVNYSVTYDYSGSEYATAHIITSNDAGSVAPVWNVVTSATSSTTGPTPGITPPDETALEVRFSLGVPNSGASRSWTPPAGLTERTDIQADVWPTGSSATRTLASSAATGTLNFTCSAAVIDRVGITVGIPSAPAVQEIVPTGIAGAEAFGSTRIVAVIGPAGIASTEAFGSLVAATPFPQTVIGEGIASAEVFGTARTRLYIGPAGVASAEAFGATGVAALIGPSGIPSAEAFGLTNVAIEQFIGPTGIPSTVAFGVPVLQLGYPQWISPVGIPTLEVVKSPIVRNRHALVLANPSVQETPVSWDALGIRFGIHRGITIMKSGGVWRSVRYPAQTEMETAERVYLGGRRHVLSLAEAEELIDAGYGDYISLEVIT